MLGAVHVPRAFALPFTHAILPKLANFKELLALKAIEKDSTETFSEILLHACHDFFEQIGFSGSKAAFALLFVEIVRQDLVDRRFRGERDEGEVLGDILPVINED